MTIQLAIEIYALLSLTCLACVVALFLKACWPDPRVRTLERRQLNTLLESPLRADSSVRQLTDRDLRLARDMANDPEALSRQQRGMANVVPVSDAEWAELDAVIGSLVEPRPTTLARMKPVSKRVM